MKKYVYTMLARVIDFYFHISQYRKCISISFADNTVRLHIRDYRETIQDVTEQFNRKKSISVLHFIQKAILASKEFNGVALCSAYNNNNRIFISHKFTTFQIRMYITEVNNILDNGKDPVSILKFFQFVKKSEKTHSFDKFNYRFNVYADETEIIAQCGDDLHLAADIVKKLLSELYNCDIHPVAFFY